MNKLKPKETQLIISIVTALLFCIIFSVLGGLKIVIIQSSSIPNTILTTAGVFIGFIMAALGIYFSIPLRTEIKQVLKVQGYYNQISRNFVISLLGFFIVSLLCVVELCIFEIINIIVMHYINVVYLSMFIFSMMISILNSISFFKVVKSN